MLNGTMGSSLHAEDRLNDRYFQDIHLAVGVVWVFLPLPAIATNAVNVRTFLAIGLVDGVSVSFVALALSDLCFSISSFMFSCSMLAAKLEVVLGVVLPINPIAFIIYFFQSASCTYPISGMTTTYLVVARCMCVVRPIQFKNVFTKSRSIAIHLVFAVFAIGSYSAVYSQMGIIQAYDRHLNVTRGMLAFTPIREEVKDVVFLIFDNILVFVTQFVMVVSVAVMTGALRRSQQFRHASTVTSRLNGKAAKYRLSGKELLVVKQVVLISGIYVVCSLPKMFTAVYSIVNPQFGLGRGLSEMYYDLYLVRNVFELINAGTTMIIYYKFYSKFRANMNKPDTTKTT